MDQAQVVKKVLECRDELQKLPHGDLRFYTTSIAVQDLRQFVRRKTMAPSIWWRVLWYPRWLGILTSVSAIGAKNGYRWCGAAGFEFARCRRQDCFARRI